MGRKKIIKCCSQCELLKLCKNKKWKNCLVLVTLNFFQYIYVSIYIYAIHSSMKIIFLQHFKITFQYYSFSIFVNYDTFYE